MHSAEQYQSFFQGLYQIQTNQWGKDESGYQILTALKENAFIVRWMWQENPSNVHAFPNIGLVFKPILLTDAELHITSEHRCLSPCRANVAIDIFLDVDAQKSADPCMASYEIMIWLDKMGEIYPVGHKNGVVARCPLDGIIFDLYIGRNHAGQKVFTWIGESRQRWDLHLQSLLSWIEQYLPAVYIGIVQVGIEEFTSDCPITIELEASIDLTNKNGD